MTEKSVMAEVRYQFSRAELLELGDDLARAAETVREVENRKKEMMADIAAELKHANGRVFALAGKIRDKFEFRETQCIALFGVPRAGMKTILRADTRAEERVEPMTEAEMQQGLDFGTTAEGATETPTQ